MRSLSYVICLAAACVVGVSIVNAAESQHDGEALPQQTTLLEAWEATETPEQRRTLLHRAQPRLWERDESIPETLLELCLLGLNDENERVRRVAVTIMNDLTLGRHWGDETVYRAYLHERAGQPISVVLAEAAAQWVDELRTAEGNRLLQIVDSHTYRVFRASPAVQRAASEAGVLDVIADRLVGVDQAPAAGLLRIVGELDADPAWIKTHVVPLVRNEDAYVATEALRVLGDPGLVLAEIKRRLYAATGPRGSDLRPLSMLLAELKAARAIPTLIGLIDADNSRAIVYDVGHFGLSNLTDVEYSPFHDGAWWRRWWDRNRQRFPGEAATLTVLDLPKTAHGKSYEPYPESMETLDGKLDYLLGLFADGEPDRTQLWSIARQIAADGEPEAIPILIGAIYADNSYDTVYGLGYFGLFELTGVEYSPFHDGAWWRRWWDRRMHRFPENVRAIAIPELPKTAHGVSYEPFPESLETLDGKIEYMLTLESNATLRYSDIAEAIAHHKDPRAIPVLIGMIAADEGYETVYGIGYFGLSALAGVEYEGQGAAWWRRWWDEHRAGFGPEVARLEVPEIILPVPAEPSAFGSAACHERMRYRLITGSTPQRPGGHRLLLVLPGGNGSKDFTAWCTRLQEIVAPQGFVVAQLVAPEWDAEQFERVVWPTNSMPYPSAEFTTEAFMTGVIADVSSRIRIDPEQVFAFGWSSGGPAVYTALADGDVPLAGGIVMMSTFRNEFVEQDNGLEGARLAVVHAPGDFIAMKFPEHAVEIFSQGGADARLFRYDGGHGWNADAVARFRDAARWLVAPMQGEEK